MSDQKPTIGQAIDQVVGALQLLDAKERKVVVTTVCQHLQIELSGSNSGKLEGPIPEVLHTQRVDVPPSNVTKSGIDIRSLKEQKKPNSARQMACLVAFYLQECAPESERKETITTSDLERYFKEANFKLPSKLEQILVDGKSAGYFNSPKRGQYALTRVGYNLVAHSMPSKENA